MRSQANRTGRTRILAALLAALLLASVCAVPAFANQSRSGNFSKNYTLTGDPVTDMVRVAKAQVGRKYSDFGYTEGWCDNFVSDCAILCGQASAIPQGGDVGDFRNKVLKAGGKAVSSPQAGDIVFYSSGGSYKHTALMIDSVNSVQGNMNGTNSYNGKCIQCKASNANTSQQRSYVRPNYKKTTPPATTYSLDVNVSADGAAFNSGHDGVSFDVYIGGKLVADNVRDFNHTYNKGTTYDVRDVQVSGCWRYTGGASVAGTLNANAVVTLPIVSNHTPKTVPGFDATCTSSGLTDGQVCAVCGKVLKAQEVVPAYGHSYLTAPVAATCLEPAGIRYTCPRCGDTYTEPASNEWSEWSAERPPADAAETEQKTQYRSSKAASEWRETGRGTVDYAASWPAGFHTGHALYAKYNVKPVQARETATERVTVETKRIGFIYWHWCYGTYANGPINRKISDTKTSTYPSFHAFYSAESRSVTESANAIRFDNGSVCKDTYWWIRTPVVINRCTWVKYERANTDGWEDFGDWQDAPITASPTERVETRTLYRYKASQKLGDHAWDEGVVTVEPLCAANGLKTYTCAVCGAVKTEPVPASGHADENADGRCDRCGERLKAPVTEPPVTQPPVSAGLRGDADLDGKVLAKDARIVLRASAKLEKLEGQALANCDLDGDGKLTAKEARLILRFSAKLETAI